MKCPCCKTEKPKWQNVDQFRIKPHGMSLCTNCGFVTYPEKYKKKEDVIEYYRHDYRPPPQVTNLFTGQNKLHYHSHFLSDLIAKWMQSGKQDPCIFDVGAAFGMFLEFWRRMQRNDTHEILFPNADLNGSELTLSFRRVAYHEYGLKLLEDFDDSKQYDLITSYKVLEHMFAPDRELERYRKAIKEDGYLYISVPTWFNRMHNFGSSGWDIEYYYHPDHVNIWSRPLFEKLLIDHGFDIIKKNYATYDATYLCIPHSDSQIEQTIPPTPKEVVSNLNRIFLANEALQNKNFEAAINLWPDFPVAQRARYEYSRQVFHELGYKAIMDQVCTPWLSIDPECYDALLFAGDISMRYDEFQKAIDFFDKALSVKPGDAQSMHLIASSLRALANKFPVRSADYHAQARDVMLKCKSMNQSAFGESVTWSYADAAAIPMPHEKKVK